MEWSPLSLWKFVWLLLPLAQLWLVASSEYASQEREELQLRVTLRKDHLEHAPSCVYTFAQLELLNLHTTDYIDILSIQTSQEETIYVSENPQQNHPHDADELLASQQQLPRQLHVSRLPSDSLTLGPGQVAIVPVSFLPRFPGRRPSLATDDPQSTISVARQVDLEEWFEQSWDDILETDGTTTSRGTPTSPRSNQWYHVTQDSLPSLRPSFMTLEEYRVSADIIVETSRGRVTLPIQVSSVRHNDYGLPDVIRFYPPQQHNFHNEPYPDSVYYSETAAMASRLQRQVQTNSLFRQTQQQLQAKRQPTNRAGTLHPEVRLVARRLETPPPQPSDASSGRTTAAEEAALVYLAANHDCYDLYLKHPFSRLRSSPGMALDSPAENQGGNKPEVDPIFVKEVALRHSDSLGLFILPGKEPSPTLVPQTIVSQALREFTEHGSLPIAADDQSHYICTICTTSPSDYRSMDLDPFGERASDTAGGGEYFVDDLQKHLSESLAQSPNSLGYIQIRTDVDTLVVALERAPDEDDEGEEEDGSVDGDDDAEEESDSLRIDHKLDASAVDEKSRINPVNTSAAELMGDQIYDLLDGKIDNGDDWFEPLLHADPESIDIHLLSSASHTARVPIDVYNAGSSHPVTIMRMSALWSSSEPDLDERVGFEVTLPGEGLEERISIDFNETLQDAFFFECSIDWDKFARDQTLSDIQFTGTVILRGSVRDWDYDEWESALKANPYMDSDLVLEIPFSVTIIKGRIGFVLEQTTYPQHIFWLKEPWKEHVESVSGIFFPLTSADLKRSFGREDLESFIEHEMMEHQLRVFSNVDIETEVRGVEIVDDELYRESRSQKLTSSICERFEVSFTDSRIDRVSDPFGLTDHTDLGLVQLTYHLTDEAADAMKDGLNNRTEPTVCYLRLMTEPDTGNHLTPLIVYSASVEVSGNTFQAETLDKAVEESDDGTGTVWQRTIVGFEKLLSWLQTTKSGATLRSALESSMMNRRLGRETDRVMLGRYLYQLADHSLHSDYSKLRPILLEAGAIAQGELETFPLYLTNNNPVPIKALIDVGEVEGMSISVGREASGRVTEIVYLIIYRGNQSFAVLGQDQQHSNL